MNRENGTEELAGHVDLALLAPETTNAAVRAACRLAIDVGIASVTVSGSKVKFASILTAPTPVGVVAAVGGFPLGQMHRDVKAVEARLAVKDGAREVDLMMNVGFFTECSPDYLLREVREVVAAADGRPVNVVLEADLLTDAQIIAAAGIAVDAGALGVVTSPGFGPGAATVADVRALREALPERVAVIAAGGVADRSAALALIEAGATRVRVTDAAVLGL